MFELLDIDRFALEQAFRRMKVISEWPFGYVEKSMQFLSRQNLKVIPINIDFQLWKRTLLPLLFYLNNRKEEWFS